MRNFITLIALVCSGFCFAQNAYLMASTESGGGGSDAISVLSPVVYYTPSSIVAAGGDGSSISQWSDTSGNGLHATPSGGTATLNVSGTDQVEFDGSVWFDVSDDASLDFDICTDNFTLIAREGDVASTTSGYLISKAESTAGNREYGIYYISSTSTGLYLGGEASSQTIPSGSNRLHIYIVTGNSYQYYVDGSLIGSGSTANCSDGAGSQSVNIGGRTDGSFVMNNGSTMDLAAIIPSAINGTERAAIETEFQIN